MSVVELGGDPLLWGATSSVEEIFSSMVSLQECLTGLTSYSAAPGTFFSARPSAHAPRKIAHFLPHNSCSGCTCRERRCGGAPACVTSLSCRRLRESPTIAQSPAACGGRTEYYVALPVTPANTADGWSAIGAASAHHPALGWLGSDCRGSEPVPQGERPVPRSPKEEPDGSHWSLCHSPSRSLAWPAPIFACLGVCHPETTDFAAVLYSASFLKKKTIPLLLVLPLQFGAKFRARSVGCVHMKVQRSRPGGHKGQKLEWLGAWSDVVKRWQGSDEKWKVVLLGTLATLCSELTTAVVARFGAPHYWLRWRELVLGGLLPRPTSGRRLARVREPREPEVCVTPGHAGRPESGLHEQAPRGDSVPECRFPTVWLASTWRLCTC